MSGRVTLNPNPSTNPEGLRRENKMRIRLRVCLFLFALVLMYPLVQTVAGEPVQAGEQKTYTVVQGDNLYNIGIKYGVASSDLIKANNLSGTTIHPGQVLVIPGNDVMTGRVSRGNAGYSRDEFDLLARLIHAEAASEPYPGKVAVGAVVLNRIRSSIFPNSITAVIYQANNGIYQFSPVYNGSINRPAGADSLRAAQEALSGADPTGGALFFFSSWVTDKHLRSRTVSKVIGNLTFAF